MPFSHIRQPRPAHRPLARAEVAAATYARAAKLGLEAQNHAAEITLRAERKAGDLLEKLERSGGPGRGKKNYQDDKSFSEYAQTLQEQVSGFRLANFRQICRKFQICTRSLSHVRQPRRTHRPLACVEVAAAEITLRAERKAGDLLEKLEKGKTGPKSELLITPISNSEYNQTLQEQDITYQTAAHWQSLAALPEGARGIDFCADRAYNVHSFDVVVPAHSLCLGGGPFCLPERCNS